MVGTPCLLGGGRARRGLRSDDPTTHQREISTGEKIRRGGNRKQRSDLEEKGPVGFGETGFEIIMWQGDHLGVCLGKR